MLYGYNTDKIVDSIFEEDLQGLRDIIDKWAHADCNGFVLLERLQDLMDHWNTVINERRNNKSMHDYDKES